MDFAATLLILAVHGLHVIHHNTNHCLIAYRSGKFGVAHSRNVGACAIAGSARVARRSRVTKDFGKPADYGPPFSDLATSAEGRTGTADFTVAVMETTIDHALFKCHTAIASLSDNGGV